MDSLTQTRSLSSDDRAVATRGDERGGWIAPLAVVLVRAAVPLWIGAGATMKLVERSPAFLPTLIVSGAGELGIDLGLLLRFFIGVELALVGLMLLMPRFARVLGMFILTVFCVILVCEWIVGAASCGCFGEVTIPPALMLGVDGALLLGLVLLGRGWERRYRASAPVSVTMAAVALAVVLGAFAVALIVPPVAKAPAASATTSVDGERQPVAPPMFYQPDYDSWVGQRWSDLELTSFLPLWPEDIDEGLWYVVLYRLTCHDCHALLETYFEGELPFRAAVIAVPERDGFPTAGTLEMPCEACVELELPSGCDWFIKTPAMLRLRDGVVECAAEVDPDMPECFDPSSGF